MTSDETHALIREVFELPDGFVFENDMRPAGVPGWDSMGWLQFLGAVEDRYGREVPLELFDRVVTVQDVCEALQGFSADGSGNTE